MLAKYWSLLVGGTLPERAMSAGSRCNGAPATAGKLSDGQAFKLTRSHAVAGRSQFIFMLRFGAKMRWPRTDQFNIIAAYEL